MKHYKLKVEDIELASKNGIVACWREELDCPVTEVNELSSSVFYDKEVVEIPENN